MTSRLLGRIHAAGQHGIKAMAATQAVELKRLAAQAYELETFKLQLTQAEAARRIAMLTAKLPLLGEPPHTL